MQFLSDIKSLYDSQDEQIQATIAKYKAKLSEETPKRKSLKQILHERKQG